MQRRKIRYSFSDGQSSGIPESPSGLPAGAEPVLSVGELTRGIRRILESTFHRVAVRGEVSGLSRPRSGHLYFTLRDGTGALAPQIAVVVFRDEALRLRFRIEDGLRVVARGRIAVYEPRGLYQVVAQRVEPDGPGEIALSFERLKARLAGEGLFSQERKRPLPFLPGRIGIVTSPTGAAIHDLLRAIYRRHPEAWVRIVPVRVQGEGSAAEIEAALDFLGRSEAGVQVAILGRGGGGPEDLWTFNEEKVVRAVAACGVPVISAVGHEVDHTLCDFAADARAQTPTHAGELAVPDMGELRLKLSDLAARLGPAVWRRLDRSREAFGRLSESWLSLGKEEVGRRAQRLDDLGRELQKSLYNTYRRWQYALHIFSGKLEVLNPLAVLRRGYSLVIDPQGRVIRRAVDLREREPIRIIFDEGSARAVVDQIESDRDGRGRIGG